MEFFKLLKEPKIDYRVDRIKGLERYVIGQIYTWDIDPAYPMLNYIFKEWNLSIEDRYWLCWLYGVTYAEATPLFIFLNFPNMPSTESLNAWHKNNWKNLLYGTDYRYKKGHLVSMYEDYLKLLNGLTQEEFFSKLCLGTPEQNFENIWKSFGSLPRWGRYSLFLYTETLKRCMNLPIKCNNMFYKEAWSPFKGMCHALKREDLIGKNVPENIDFISKETDRLIEQFNKKYPNYNIDYHYWETSLCAYRGMYEKKRYLGYYIDRFQENTLKMEKQTNTRFEIIWKFREKELLHEFLGEFNRYTGIQDKLLPIFAMTGQIVGSEILEQKGVYID